jgi:hypothetical protein
MSLDSTSVHMGGLKKQQPLSETKKLTHCSVCNQPIGLISVTMYEVEDKHYCAQCYSQLIIAEAAKRDHDDILKEKKLR